MNWKMEQTDEGMDFTFDSVEQGIGPSPLKGTANIQNANISTELGEVMASYARTNQAPATITNGTLTASVGDGATLLTAPSTLKAGMWVRVSASSITSITAATNPASVSVNYVLVAGGGGGGGVFSAGGAAGGGGAGGMKTGTSSVSAGSYPIVVGSGGAGGSTSTAGSTGVNTTFNALTANGGGGGGSGSNGGSNNGVAGGSGGGGGGDTAGAVSGTAGAGTGGQGNNGGVGRSAAIAAGAGGGGAGAVGSNPSGSGQGGKGGDGTASSITGASVTYAGGGGGGAIGTFGIPGSGGGGQGAGTNAVGGNATANTGGGGGGAAGNDVVIHDGGKGGSGIVVISYPKGSMYAVGGTVTEIGGNTIHTFTASDTFKVLSIPTGGLYYVSYKDTNNKVKLSAAYDPTGAYVTTHGTSGTATFSTVAIPGAAIAKATEPYATATTNEYRYYILDNGGYVWVYDTAIYKSSLIASGVATLWMMTDPTNYSALGFTGMAVLNGWLHTISVSQIYGKPTADLGYFFRGLPNGYLNSPFATHTNFALVGSQGKMYYCDDSYIGELFPTTSFVTSLQNVQSYASYTASSTTGTISALIGGAAPYLDGTTRLPSVFFTDVNGTIPTALVTGTVYYILFNQILGTFGVYSTATGGSALDIATGAVGNQYFNTYYPLGNDASINGTHTTVQFTPQRLNLPFYDTAQCLVELGNTVLIGCAGKKVYPWNQVDAVPSDVINLPESNVVTMVNVNNMAYIFAGNKGNIYISNGSIASLVLKVPDYCAGVPGSPLTYIEPSFSWGDAMYVRGRVYFSILDQTSTKAGNCGGVWSFVPSQNMYIGQDVGTAMRLENQNSYGSYNGVATILIPNEDQTGVAPQYWSAWQNSYSVGTSTFGIDQTATTPVTTFVVETDLSPTGTILSKDTFTQLEYKLTTPLKSGDSVQMFYRLNATDAWTTCGTTKTEPLNPISGYYEVTFQNTQWVQFRVVFTTGGTTASSFCRFNQIRLR